MTSRLAPLIAIAFAAAACGSEPAAPQPARLGGDVPVTAARLTGSTLRYIRDDPPIEWTFTATTFTVASSSGRLPADLADALVAPGADVARVEGRWRLDGAKLVLTDLPRGEVVLPVRPAGPLRCDLDERQYNIHERHDR